VHVDAVSGRTFCVRVGVTPCAACGDLACFLVGSGCKALLWTRHCLGAPGMASLSVKRYLELSGEAGCTEASSGGG